jgi:hypothetical protein
MAQPLRWPIVFFCLLSATSSAFMRPVAAETIWSGLTKSFTKMDNESPAPQDTLTSSVVLTRGDSGGMINSAAESFFNRTISPTGTKWATDLNNAGKTIAATNHADLAFTDWLDAYGGARSGGGFIEGRDAVVWLVSDNVFLDLRFTSWTGGNGGGYSYLRAEPPVASPTGDYNGNGRVDAADYVLWRKTLNQTGIPLGTGADGNSSGTIDAGDYTYWRQRFGTPISGSGATATVPEPGAGLCGLCALGLLIATRGLNGRCRDSSHPCHLL